MPLIENPVKFIDADAEEERTNPCWLLPAPWATIIDPFMLIVPVVALIVKHELVPPLISAFTS
jgi:hypothetical protein